METSSRSLYKAMSSMAWSLNPFNSPLSFSSRTSKMPTAFSKSYRISFRISSFIEGRISVNFIKVSEFLRCAMSFFKTKEGVTLFHRYFPNHNRPTIVFVHGLGLDHTTWDRYVNHFEKKYGILTLDLRGHGRSAKPSEKEEYRINYFVDYVAQLLASLNIKDYFLIGYSLGGVRS